MGEFSKPIREAVVRCDELDYRVLVNLVPEGQEKKAWDVPVPGITSQVRVFLRPGTAEDEAVQTFLRKRMVQRSSGRVRRSRVLLAWKAFLLEDPTWRGVDVPQGRFFRRMRETLGDPAKVHGQVCYNGWIIG